MDTFKNRFNEKIAVLEKNAAEIGRNVARRHLEVFENKAIEAAKFFGNMDFNVILHLVTFDGTLQMCFQAKTVSISADQKTDEYRTLSNLERQFFIRGYESAWKEAGMKYTPIDCKQMQFSKFVE